MGTEYTWNTAAILKGDNFYDILFCFPHTESLLKRGLLFRGEVIYKGGKSILADLLALKVYPDSLTLALLNKLRCHTHF